MNAQTTQGIHPSLGSPTAVYEYQRASGDVAFVVCRFEPKDFRPAQVRDGRWYWNLHDAPVLPYRLPEIERALAAGETIWIVDGEKDADALVAQGVCATCCARSQNWTIELAEQFTGARRIRIVADRDGGTGERQAREVAQLLVDAGAIASIDIEIVQAAEGKDAFDHLAAGRGLGEFEWLGDTIPPEAAPETQPWMPLKATAFLDLPEPEGSALLGPLVLRGGRTIIGGDSGHGKTTLTYAMIAAIVQGTELLGHRGVGLGPALILDLEQGVRSIKRGIREADLDDNVYILNLPDGLALDQNPEELTRLEETIASLRPTVLSLDPYYKAHRGDANEERAVTDLMRNLDRLRTDYGFALLLPAHVRKEVQGGGARKLTLADIAGSGAISRGAEVVLGVERLSHGQARLRYLKDREGDLPVGDALELEYSHEEGFTVKQVAPTESIEGAILAIEQSGWMTVKEWQGEIGFRERETKRTLERLAAAGKVAFAIGPPGRSRQARCYSTLINTELLPNDGSTPEQPGAYRDEGRTAPLLPTTPVGGGSAGAGHRPQETAPIDSPDLDYLATLAPDPDELETT